MDTKRIGRRIKAFRKLKGYTQIDFAKELQVSISEIGSVERGTKPASEDLLNDISVLLNIPIEEITME